MLPPWLPLVFTVDVSPDVRVLFFAVALTFGTGILFGLAPALQVSKSDLHASMKHDSERAGSQRDDGRLRGTLVGVQVALCMVLMIAAGLLLRGLMPLTRSTPVSGTETSLTYRSSPRSTDTAPRSPT